MAKVNVKYENPQPRPIKNVTLELSGDEAIGLTALLGQLIGGWSGAYSTAPIWGALRDALGDDYTAHDHESEAYKQAQDSLPYKPRP